MQMEHVRMRLKPCPVYITKEDEEGPSSAPGAGSVKGQERDRDEHQSSFGGRSHDRQRGFEEVAVEEAGN